jgi:hypothetical protein
MVGAASAQIIDQPVGDATSMSGAKQAAAPHPNLLVVGRAP